MTKGILKPNTSIGFDVSIRCIQNVLIGLPSGRKCLLAVVVSADRRENQRLMATDKGESEKNEGDC